MRRKGGEALLRRVGGRGDDKKEGRIDKLDKGFRCENQSVQNFTLEKKYASFNNNVQSREKLCTKKN